MKASERKIVLNLLDRFRELEAFRFGGRLISGTECKLGSESIVRPALSYFTLEQLQQPDGSEPVPTWVVEITAPTDRFYLMEDKVTEYFQSGVQVAWEIFPPFERVRIFRPLQEIIEMTDDAICSADPAVEDLEISVADLFKSR